MSHQLDLGPLNHQIRQSKIKKIFIITVPFAFARKKFNWLQTSKPYGFLSSLMHVSHTMPCHAMPSHSMLFIKAYQIIRVLYSVSTTNRIESTETGRFSFRLERFRFLIKRAWLSDTVHPQIYSNIFETPYRQSHEIQI